MTSWGELLEQEPEARRVASREIKKAERGEKFDQKKIREWWRIVEAVLIEAKGRPIPVRLLKVLSGLAGYLAAGQVPSPISRVAQHRPAIGPSEKHDIRMAVTYHKAADKRIINDPHPTKTVRECYSLRSDSTVRGWCRKFEPFDYFAADLENEMRRSGARYQVANRRTGTDRMRG